MKLFKDLNPGDTVYHIKLENYRVVKPNNVDTHRSAIVKSFNQLNDTKYFDVILSTGETIFPCGQLETHVMISHTESKTIHNIFSTSRKQLFEAAIKQIKTKVLGVRREQDKLKNDELELVNNISSLLREEHVYKDEMTLEEVASMAM